MGARTGWIARFCAPAADLASAETFLSALTTAVSASDSFFERFVRRPGHLRLSPLLQLGLFRSYSDLKMIGVSPVNAAGKIVLSSLTSQEIPVTVGWGLGTM
jgi:hypothetical protein